MNVLLINPPQKHMITTNIPSFVDEERGFSPPLGLLYIAAYAEKYTDASIKIFDMVVEEACISDLKRVIHAESPDIVGVTITTFTLIDAILVAQAIKKIDKTIKIVFGGPHAHIYPEETINFDFVDFVVLGEGEITFTELVNNFQNYDALKKIKGLVFKQGSDVIHTGQKEFIENLDVLPFPARHLTPYKKYYSLIGKKNPITTMFTSRGCPYRCTFCYRPHLGKKFRARSPENVVDEIEYCKNMGIEDFLIYDDTFTIDRDRAIKICNLIIERDLEIFFDIRARVNTVDKELLETLQKSGCYRIHYGVESANPNILKVLKKGITIDQIENAFRLTKIAGITTLAYFMIGSPGETRDEIFNTIQFAKKLNPDYCHFAITTPFPGTPLYKMMLDCGIAKTDYWQGYAKEPDGDFVPQVWDEILTRDELVDLLETAYRSFYLRPRYVAKTILGIRSFNKLRKYSKAGYKLFRG